MQYNTIQYNTIQLQLQLQYNTIQYNTIQYNTIQYNTIQFIDLYIYVHLFTVLIIMSQLDLRHNVGGERADRALTGAKTRKPEFDLRWREGDEGPEAAAQAKVETLGIIANIP